MRGGSHAARTGHHMPAGSGRSAGDASGGGDKDAKYYQARFDSISRVIAELKGADINDELGQDIEVIRTWISQAQAYLAAAEAKAELAVESAKKAFAAENEKVALLKEREALFKDAAAIGGVTAKQDTRGVVLTLHNMFASNENVVLVEQTYLLDEIAELARKYPCYPIVIEGYTDARGRDADNLALSQGRAQSVRDYLVQRQKLDFDRLKSSGYGEANPVADNSSAADRAKNRRVEVIFLFR